MNTAIILLLISLVALLFIPALVGVYVYRDAKSRGMNATLWTLIAVLAPALIGFIIYLLVRGSYSDLKCPRCAAPVSEQYASCPNCGERLKPFCPSCGAPVELAWKVCPQCAAPLPEQYAHVSMPVRRQDKTLGKILIAVVLIPVILIAVSIFSFSAFTPSTGSTGVTSLPIDDYLQQADRPQIEAWLDTCVADYDGAYALKNKTVRGDQVEVLYLIYMPRLTEMPQISVSPQSGLFGNTLSLEITAESGSTGNTLLLVTCTGTSAQNLALYYGGDRVDCTVTEVDYPLGLLSN